MVSVGEGFCRSLFEDHISSGLMGRKRSWTAKRSVLTPVILGDFWILPFLSPSSLVVIVDWGANSGSRPAALPERAHSGPLHTLENPATAGDSVSRCQSIIDMQLMAGTCEDDLFIFIFFLLARRRPERPYLPTLPSTVPSPLPSTQSDCPIPRDCPSHHLLLAVAFLLTTSLLPQSRSPTSISFICRPVVWGNAPSSIPIRLSTL